jgi:hypothetical protein
MLLSTLALTLSLTLVLAFLSSQVPPLARSLGVWPLSLLRTPRKLAQKYFFRLISVPVRCSHLLMAKSGPPHSGDSRASRVAARFASAFNLESLSSLHVFHTSRP